MATDGTAAKKADAPAPDDPRKPDGPEDLHATSWRFTGKKAFSEFTRDQCTDLAAGLTYYSVLALFPGLVAVVSLLGVVGQAEQTTAAMLDLIRGIAPGEAADQLRAPIEQMTQSKGSGLGLVIGILGALWSASGYVGAFGRAMNRIYEVDEGRPIWKLRPIQLLITLVCVVMVALLLVGLVVSGPIAETIGRMLGLGSFGLTVFNVIKWPVMLAIVVALVALLYYSTPNVQQPKFRWVSVGSIIAILIWILLSVVFGFYVANFGNYNKTYGALGGVIIFLLWIWITNNALLLGAEVDSEMERSRQLQAGIEAERSLQLPPRDTRASDKAEEKREELIGQGREIREHAEARGDDAVDRPARATEEPGS
ncbi:YihY/virulence factor BrkB family protein [Mariniluteicoccus flavus]